MNRFFMALCAGMAACASLPAFAETFSGTVRAGSTTVVSSRFISTAGCDNWAPPEVQGKPTAPNGRLTFSIERVPFVSQGHPCNGMSMVSMVVRYTPNKGFRGVDRFSINYTWDRDDGGRKGGISDDFVIEVK